MNSTYESIRSAVVQTGTDSRVEVNQRALIDKILARYASAGAVYRELLQNSNDAEAKLAQIHFTTVHTEIGIVVTQVVYRNNGHPFQAQDWTRLRRIAEGNPDVSKVGAFGVGAYTMFSICEEPLVISGGKALAFTWKNDSLWVRLANSPHLEDQWTSFVLKSRDYYPLPDLVEFGQFLCSSLTFTNFLSDLELFVDGQKRLTISKRPVGQPRVITPPKSSTWWSNDGAVTSSPGRVFSLGHSDGSITESTLQLTVTIQGTESIIKARYVSATADTRVPPDMTRRIVRVTKKKPPPQVKVEIFIGANSASTPEPSKKTSAGAITDAFIPRIGAGHVFIGFKTSQTTGLAVHLAAPLIPTVEREAIDFQEPTLRMYNNELLSIAGILMRLTLEHSMDMIGRQWAANADERRRYEVERKEKETEKGLATGNASNAIQPEAKKPKNPEVNQQSQGILSFARFMASGMQKLADGILSTDFLGDGEGDLLRPHDPRPLYEEEHAAVALMRAFAPQPSTPDPRVGSVLAEGFEMCFRGLSPPVLTKSGIARGRDCRLPCNGIEGFVETRVVRSIVLKNAKDYLIHVAGCSMLGLHDLSTDLKDRPLNESDLIRLLKWWTKYYKMDPFAMQQGTILKNNILFRFEEPGPPDCSEKRSLLIPLQNIEHFVDDLKYDQDLPMPATVLPRPIQDKLTIEILKNRSFNSWFAPLQFRSWVGYVARHPAMTAGSPSHSSVRVRVLARISEELMKQVGLEKTETSKLLKLRLSGTRCIPFDGKDEEGYVTDFPNNLYFPSAALDIFEGHGSIKRASSTLSDAGVSEELLLTLGVRKTISMEFLFSQLDSLKWSRNPKPLINYLRTASLSAEDLDKLKTTQYLPEATDKTRPYAPPELFLPGVETLHFPFVKVLHWPSNDILHDRSPEWQFLKELGCREEVPLKAVVYFLETDTEDSKLREYGYNYIYNQLTKTDGAYQSEYVQVMGSKFLPAKVEDPLSLGTVENRLESPKTCFSHDACKCLGFPILDLPNISNHRRGYTEVFRVAPSPPIGDLVRQLLKMTSVAKRMIENKGVEAERKLDIILEAFEMIFQYMSSKVTEVDERTKAILEKECFIPLRTNSSKIWYSPGEVFFEKKETSSLTSHLFIVRTYSPFLAIVGVKSEPSTGDILNLLLSSPQKVLLTLGGEEKYCTLLRRIAVSPDLKVTAAMRKAPFLLGFRFEDDEVEGRQRGMQRTSELILETSTPAKAQLTLARADDICIVDNSHFANLFKVLHAPQDRVLEDFYKTLGSANISEFVKTSHAVSGGQRSDTELTNDFAKRVRERRPLLVSRNIENRVAEAEDLLSDEHLNIYEVSEVKAIYSYRGVTKTEKVTCAASVGAKKRVTVFITQDYDWFDVGKALGGVILTRCNLREAVLIEYLFESSLGKLRKKGFPVDLVSQSSDSQKVYIESSQSEGKKQVETEASENNRKKENGLEDILTQMFPDCDSGYVRKLLGPKPDLDSLKAAAEKLSIGMYPRKKHSPVQKRVKTGREACSPPPPEPPSLSTDTNSGSSTNTLEAALTASPEGSEQGIWSFSRSKSRNIFSSGFRKLRHFQSAGASGVQSRVQKDRDIAWTTISDEQVLNDPLSSQNMKQLLQKSVRASKPVSPEGIWAQEQQIVSRPETLEKSAGTCEVIPAQDLKPVSGPHGNGKTSSGVQVFASRKNADSEEMMLTKWESVEQFAAIVLQLCKVYSLHDECVAIYHESSGRTIAFNAGRAIHFNFRYFLSLHAEKVTVDCYSYWFTVMAHELAHNLVAAHSKEHGFFTESYVHTYLPKLLSLLRPP